MKLLDTTGDNTKLEKTNKGSEYRVAGLTLFPDDKLCPARHIAECAGPCLQSAGRGAMSNVISGRKAKAAFYHSDTAGFLDQLRKEITNFEKLCNKTGKKPAIRLNVLSDIQWERHGIPQEFPNVLFYDYTKISKRLGKTPSNYKLMFSYSGADKYQKHVKEALKTSVPMSVVFKGTLPETYSGRRVIDGDKSDLDNLFAGKVIVGLRAKGKAKTDTSKFIVVANT